MESTKHFLKSEFRKLTLKAGAPADTLAITAWSNIAEKLVEKFGEEKFSRAVQKWLEQEQFFPANPNDLRKFLPLAQRDTCPTCSNSEGWVEIVARHPSDGREYKAFTRCKHGRAA
jgi:hypothetical protein